MEEINDNDKDDEDHDYDDHDDQDSDDNDDNDDHDDDNFPPIRHTVKERPERCIATSVVVQLEVIFCQPHRNHLV